MTLYKDGSKGTIGGVECTFGGERKKSKWYNKLGCFFGLHEWTWLLSETKVVDLNGPVPDCAQCMHCGRDYRKEKN